MYETHLFLFYLVNSESYSELMALLYATLEETEAQFMIHF